MVEPNKWRMAGLFLALVAPSLLMVWWLRFYSAMTDSGLSPHLSQSLNLLVPVLAAAIAGVVWRGRVQACPVWATRRPYARLMAYLLFAYVTMIMPFLRGISLALFMGDGVIMSWPHILKMAASSFPRTLPEIIAVLAMNFLICLIQTDIGLSLGVWIRDRTMRASAERT